MYSCNLCSLYAKESIITSMKRSNKASRSILSERQKPGGGLTDMGALRRVDQSSWMAKVRSALGDVEGDVEDAANSLDISTRRLYDYIDDVPSLEKTKDRFQRDAERKEEEKEEKEKKKEKKEDEMKKEVRKLSLGALQRIIKEEMKRASIRELKLGVASSTPVMGTPMGGEPQMSPGEPVEPADMTDAGIPEFMAFNSPEVPDRYVFDGDSLVALDGDGEEMAYWDGQARQWVETM